MTADTPDTGKILLDIERAATRVRDYLSLAETDSEVARGLAANVEVLLDGWSYLRYCLEKEGAPLPRAWAYPHRTWLDGDGTHTAGPFGSPDEQLAFLRTAVKGLDTFLEEHPQFHDEGTAVTACGELAAKADHLAACAAAVDTMCADEGILPTAWAQARPVLPVTGKVDTHTIRRIHPGGQFVVESSAVSVDPLLAELAGEGERVEAEQERYRQMMAADPRVTAGGGAAAKAGWDLSATTIDTVIVTRAGVRVTIERLDPNQVFDSDPFGEGLGKDPY